MAHIKHPTKGEGWWYIVIRPEKGSRRQKYIPFRGSAAEAAAIDLELQGKTGDVEYPSVNDLLPRFLPDYQNNNLPGSYEDLQYALKKLLPYFGEMRIPLLLPHHFEEYKTQRLGDTYLPGKPWQRPEDDRPGEAEKRRPLTRRTINRELTYLKALLTFAEEQKISVPYRPKMFPKNQTQPKTPIVLSPEEIVAVLDQLQGDFRTLASLMFWAGLRKTEAQQLRVRDIDLPNNCIIVTGKGNKVRVVPILDPALAEDIGTRLEALRAKQKELMKGKGRAAVEKALQEQWLIVNPQTGKPFGTIMKTLRAACIKAGVSKHVYHHLLRHTFGTASMVSGMQTRSIQGMMGHSDIRTTEKYTHIAAQFLQVEGAKLTGLIRGEAKGDKSVKE